MTPLAQRIVRELTLSPRHQTFRDGSGMLGAMSDIHCFEISSIIPAIQQLITSGISADEGSDAVRDRIAALAEHTSFLPAPRTWIEWGSNGARIGCLLEEIGDGAFVRFASFEPRRDVFCSVDYAVRIGLGARGGRSDQYVPSRDLRPGEEIDVGDFSATLNGALAFINAHRVVGREVKPPHRGLEKKIRAALRDRVDFQFHPWTEIKLHLTPPEGVSGVDRGPLTGQRALHFCRSHLRLRNGKLEIVRAHMRGNVAAGVRQTSYRVLGEVKR